MARGRGSDLGSGGFSESPMTRLYLCRLKMLRKETPRILRNLGSKDPFDKFGKNVTGKRGLHSFFDGTTKGVVSSKKEVFGRSLLGSPLGSFC